MATIQLIVSTLGSVAVIVVAVLGYLTRKGINSVHEIVNSQRTDMIVEIKSLRDDLAIAKASDKESIGDPE